MRAGYSCATFSFEEPVDGAIDNLALIANTSYVLSYYFTIPSNSSLAEIEASFGRLPWAVAIVVGRSHREIGEKAEVDDLAFDATLFMGLAVMAQAFIIVPFTSCFQTD